MGITSLSKKGEGDIVTRKVGRRGTSEENEKKTTRYLLEWDGNSIGSGPSPLWVEVLPRSEGRRESLSSSVPTVVSEERRMRRGMDDTKGYP